MIPLAHECDNDPLNVSVSPSSLKNTVAAT